MAPNKNQNEKTNAVVPFGQQHPVPAKTMEPLTMPIQSIFKLAEDNNLPASVDIKLGDQKG